MGNIYGTLYSIYTVVFYVNTMYFGRQVRKF